MISIIAAVGKNLELGKDGGLCFGLKGDMQFFKQTTLGHKVIMGSTTYESLPGGALKDRENYVLTRRSIDWPNVTELHSVDEAVQKFASLPEEVFIIGGASIYAQFLPYAQKLYLTEVMSEAPADVFFPDFDRSLYTRTVLGEKEEVEKHSKQPVKYQFVLYEKRSSL